MNEIENEVYRYTYVGTAIELLGKTALGKKLRGTFKVQVDDLGHPWAFGWHQTSRKDWRMNRRKH